MHVGKSSIQEAIAQIAQLSNVALSRSGEDTYGRITSTVITSGVTSVNDEVVGQSKAHTGTSTIAGATTSIVELRTTGISHTGTIVGNDGAGNPVIALQTSGRYSYVNAATDGEAVVEVVDFDLEVITGVSGVSKPTKGIQEVTFTAL